jgi:integrase/recombinase XerD
MLKQQKRRCGQVCAKSIRRVLESYEEYLASQGFSVNRRRAYVRAVEHFGTWIGRRKVCRSIVQEFLDQALPECQCSGVSHDRRMIRAALNHLLKMLGVGEGPPAYLQGCLGDVLRRYQEHLADTKGLARETVVRHLKYTRDMLRRLGTRRESQFRHWTPELIEEDVARESRLGPGHGRNVAWCARIFLRFLLQEGLIRRDLATAVPTVARWRLATLPTTLSEEEIDQLVDAADQQTSVGLRNRAIILCLSELGLRGADVANLRVGDIDFTAGVLRLRQRKERQADVFPLTPRLRAALLVYLQNVRPDCTSEAVFVRDHAPVGQPLTPGGIGNVVRRLADLAGLSHRVTGPHALRRSLASRMINAGVTLKQIADFLGHASIDTTTLYAKVDLTTLSRVAMPWPGAERKAVRS